MTILLIVFLLGAPDSLDTTFTNVNQIYLSSDTTIIPAEPVLVRIVKTSKQTLLEKYQGLIGSFLGVFGAFVIAFITFYLNRKKEKDSEKEKYCGLLLAVKVELDSHRSNFPKFLEDLDSIEHIFTVGGKVIFDKYSRILRSSYLSEIRSLMLTYENFNTTLYANLTEYLHYIEKINSDLNFNSLTFLLKNADSLDYKSIIKNYINSLKTNIKQLEDHIPYVLGLVNEDLIQSGKLPTKSTMKQKKSSEDESKSTQG